MPNNLHRACLLAAGLAVIPSFAQAHFRLLAPASWIEESALGDPQKAGPCGGTNADFGKPTYAVTDVKGGASLHIKVQETVYHPGHYRVALAVNSPTELPLDPKATTMTDDKGRVMSVSADIHDPGGGAGAGRWVVSAQRQSHHAV